MRAIVVALAVALATGACTARYTGTARPIAPTTVASEPGWRSAPVDAVRQRTDADCGAAALAMIAQRWRPQLTLDAVTRAAPPRDGGILLGQLRAVARAHGLRAYAVGGDRATVARELAAGRPLIVGLVRPHGRAARSHYEVVVAMHADGRVATIDPADGAWRVRPWSGLDAEWRPGAYPTLVVLGPDDARDPAHAAR